MLKDIKLLDTNIIVRFLTKDNSQQLNEIIKLFKESENKSIEVNDSVIIETYFVLDSVYEMSKEEIIDLLNSLTTFSKFIISKNIFLLALDIFEKNNISFMDAYLCSKSVIEEKELVTYDKKLSRINAIYLNNPK